ncbi:alginate lyase family protein [Cedecea sp. P7760]|uniref:alginate lyase family protein n=1 Tax=Cedecea sp. P7760 TaxID=2726983 RepID=UPI0015A21D88|nr:alginate lyase family protein [Cedecea sp. P7760]NWC61840.1 alginate lyase family protein [Cedecea sp. P7760]
MSLFRCSLFALLCGSAPLAFSAPLLLDMAQLAHSKQEISQQNPVLMPAWQALKHKADQALIHPLYSITQKSPGSPAGDPHEYYSFSDYWWPDPKAPAGLPWVRKDGQINPAAVGKQSDKARLNGMTNDVWNLALAWQLSGNAAYAAKARQQLVNWFITPETRMTPNLANAQSIPGRKGVRGTGILDGRGFVRLIDAIELLHDGGQLDEKTWNGLRQWYRDYYQWLTTSENGRKEAAAENNHGTWYDVQAAAIALWLGDKDAAKQRLISATQRIPVQFDAKGVPVTEIERTRSWHYSNFILDAWNPLGLLGEKVGVNVWQAKSGEHSLQNGYLYIAGFVDSQTPWPYPNMEPFKPDEALENIVTAAHAWRENNTFQDKAKWLLNRNKTAVINLISKP